MPETAHYVTQGDPRVECNFAACWRLDTRKSAEFIVLFTNVKEFLITFLYAVERKERTSCWIRNISSVSAIYRRFCRWRRMFFHRYPLRAKKYLQFEAFCQAADLISCKQHLTAEGIEQIRALKREDSRSALDAHATWGAPEITRAQSPPVKP